jgi:predicted glycogen debranching enzyme
MIALGRDICADECQSLRREWLVTNGIGGYASGTIAGANTRACHGLLVASLPAPLGRVLLLAKLDATARLRGRPFGLDANEWSDGRIDPPAQRWIESVRLERSMPTWTYALDEARLVKRVWMDRGRNATWVTYEHARGADALELSLTVLATCRRHEGQVLGPVAPTLSSLPDGVRIDAFEGAPPLFVRSAGAIVEPLGTWYRGFRYRADRERGLIGREELYGACRLRFVLQPGGTRAVLAACDADTSLDWRASADRCRARDEALLAPGWLAAEPEWIRQLALSTDDFLVTSPADGEPRRSIVAGYHGLGEWGRDAMISLPGLCLAMDRPEEARSILRAYAEPVQHGLVPNRLRAGGQAADDRSADASLWLFVAVQAYWDETGDFDLVGELYETLADIVAWHVRGTRYGIVADADGLLSAGVRGLQLTWMDAKAGERAVTPRIGKPVEVNALWVGALRLMARVAEELGRQRDADAFAERANLAGGSFVSRFWYAAGGYLYDVIDGPNGDDPSLRPNQLIACALDPPLLSRNAARSVLGACARALVTSYGLRTLAPSDPRYVGIYGGDAGARDGAYHQGTVWAWLMGPFVAAHLQAYGDPDAARSFLEPFADHLTDAGLGTISEIFDGDAPHRPRGAIAQAWSVAEVMRAWRLCRHGPWQRRRPATGA